MMQNFVCMCTFISVSSLECRVHLPLRSVPNRRGASSSSLFPCFFPPSPPFPVRAGVWPLCGTYGSCCPSCPYGNRRRAPCAPRFFKRLLPLDRAGFAAAQSRMRACWAVGWLSARSFWVAIFVGKEKSGIFINLPSPRSHILKPRKFAVIVNFLHLMWLTGSKDVFPT